MAVEALTKLSQVPLSTLKGVGPSLAEKLDKIGLHSVQDILFHLPLRYEDKTRVTTVRNLMPGVSTNIIGEITDNQITHGKRRMLVVTLNDGTGNIQLCFFFVWQTVFWLWTVHRGQSPFHFCRFRRNLDYIHVAFLAIRFGPVSWIPR